MSNESSIPETKKHIEKVIHFADSFCTTLKNSKRVFKDSYYTFFENSICFLIEEQVKKHDDSKMKSPEVEIFDIYTPKLKEITYGSPEYKECLKQMNVALEHHYQVNSHHPEHFPNGISGMTLVDLIEMFCDWKAATMRHKDGNLTTSIEKNAIERPKFNLQDDIKQVLLNSIKLFESNKSNNENRDLIDLVNILCEWKTEIKVQDKFIDLKELNYNLQPQEEQIILNSNTLFN